MKSIILILSCSVCLSFSLSAQEKMKGKMQQYMPMMTRSIGFTLQNFEGLNNRIAGFPGYEPLKRNIWTLSAGSMHVMKNFVSQITVTGGSSLTGDPDEQSSTVRFLGGGLDLGYDVIPSDMVMVYPMVGIGGECYTAVFYKDVSGIDFDDVANSPGLQNSIRSVKFKNKFLTYRLGLGIAFKSPKNSGTIGIQAGYSGGFRDRDWKSAENQKLNGAPSDELHRFAVSLVLTGGAMMGCMKK